MWIRSNRAQEQEWKKIGLMPITQNFVENDKKLIDYEECSSENETVNKYSLT